VIGQALCALAELQQPWHFDHLPNHVAALPMSLIVARTNLPDLPGAATEIDAGSQGTWVAACDLPAGPMIVTGQARFANPLESPGSLVRLFDSGDVLVIAPRARRGYENACILSPTGMLQSRFAVGDGVADALIVAGLVVCSYFDEGVLPGGPYSGDGVSVFDTAGRQVLGYHSDVAGAIGICDCYCITQSAPDEICFSAYEDFTLVRVNILSGRQRLHELPEPLHGCTALSVRGEEVFLHDPYDAKGTLFRWTPGTAPAVVGTHRGQLRGRATGDFLAPEPHGYAMIHVGDT
jgi:hypothetical protein